MPLPASLVVKNGSKRWGRTSAAMPEPVSVTESRKAAPSPRAAGAVSRTSRPPSGMASRALTARLRIDLLELARVGPHRGHAGQKALVELDRLPEDAVQHGEGTRHHRVQVHHPGLRHLLPAEAQELPGELGRPLGGEDDLGRGVVRGAGPRAGAAPGCGRSPG